jgi:hypothetical protein
MKHPFLIAVLAFVPVVSVWGEPASAVQTGAPTSDSAPAKVPSMPANRGNDEENARQARTLLDQAIQALGGQAYLNVHDMEQQGRTYSFHHGSASGGVVFWRFVEYPDKERVEVTPQRDVAVLYIGEKGYELTCGAADFRSRPCFAPGSMIPLSRFSMTAMRWPAIFPPSR